VKVFVTGIRGFLGGQLERYWTSAGYTVAGTVRHDPVPGSSLDGFDVIVHAAYDSKGGVERNVAAARAVCAAGEKAGVRYQIFISSYAARRESQAVYGRMKYQLETYFLEQDHAIVRPGLVIGNGGMFGRNLKKILHSPVIPLLDGGRDLIPVIAVEDFLKSMDILVARRSVGAFNLFNRELVPMRTLIETINRAAGRRPLMVNVPLNLALILLTLTEKLHIPFPSGADNVRSLKQSLPHVFESDLETIIRHPCPFQTMIESAVHNELHSPKR
jgi:uncharacterized protein YbjT (DUF2867 family)